MLAFLQRKHTNSQVAAGRCGPAPLPLATEGHSWCVGLRVDQSKLLSSCLNAVSSGKQAAMRLHVECERGTQSHLDWLRWHVG